MLSIALMLALSASLAGCQKQQTNPAANHDATRQPSPNAAGPPTQPGPQPATNSTTNSEKAKFDACALLTSREIQSVQGEAVKDAKSGGGAREGSGNGFSVSQCVFTLPTFANSISLAVTRRGDGQGARDPKQFWKETFHSDNKSGEARKAEADKDREREEEGSAAPERVAGVGDDAFWTGNRVGGALYVLKNNVYLRISVGGAGDEKTKIRKSKALAQLVLKRL